MNDLFSSLLGQLGESGIEKIGGLLGKDNNQTKGAISTAAGILFQGLWKNTETKEGEQSLIDAINKKHDGSVLDNLDWLLNNNDNDGQKILKHILGSKTENTKKILEKNDGLNQNQASTLLEKLAPLVLGTLGKEKQKGNLDLWSLSTLLKGSWKSANDNSSLAMNLMTKFLDSDGDWEIADDLLEKGAKFIKWLL